MSSARCLNWSRPPPGRHPALLRKQLSIGSIDHPSVVHHPGTSVTSPPEPPELAHFLVTGAIIHANRLQTYRTYNQAHRGTSASGLRFRSPAVAVPDDDGVPGADPDQQQHRRRRPASASVNGERTAGVGRSAGRGVILCKQLSLDRNILVAASTIASGMASTVASAVVGTEREDPGDGWAAFNRKQQRTGTGNRNDSDTITKKGLKPAKDSRINIKIFLGQTVQHDSSDTGISDTEGTNQPTTVTTIGAQPGGNGRNVPPSCPKPEPATMNTSTDTLPGKQKPTGSTVGNTGQGVTTGTVGNGTGSGSGGRTSSLAQRRAQFQANRQNSEAHDRRHPPLVRAMSAPIRPADSDTSKFLQSKKKPRRRKVLREKDEYNICEEDEFSDDGGSKMAPSIGSGNGMSPTATGGRNVPPCILPMRSRSVIGGPCDIETLVSLLSSGGSDSEKEQDSTQVPATQPGTNGQQSPTGVTPSSVAFRTHQFSSVQLAKGRAPMLKKTGKSVSFQESDLKPAAPAGLNRDYRKPTFQPTVASRIRRTQQLVSTLNAFQLKDRDRGEEKDTNEGKHEHLGNGEGEPATDLLTPAVSPANPSTNGASKTEANKSTTVAIGGGSGNGDLQTPKEQECYRLFLKMSKKGLAVSYDTILRGMLTPTELRVLQKKKSRLRSGSDVENGSEHGTDGEPSPENVGPECGVTFGQLSFGQAPSTEGGMQLSITEESPPLPNHEDERLICEEKAC